MKKLYSSFVCSLLCMALFANNNPKDTNVGAEIDVYFEYSPIESVTLTIGEEFALANFLTPQAGLFGYSNTIVGVSYTPHPNITVEAGYEFLYLAPQNMEHTVQLAATPTVTFGNFVLYLKETAQMTHATTENALLWKWVSELNLSYAIPQTPLSPYVYVEMTNPLQANPESWYEQICYCAGLDWQVNNNHTLGIYYSFTHTPNSYFHLIGIGYTLSI
ncbi:MAG: DUF2490 domain-containing protein [Paludibacteraceae bacterium]|nr:DUF2490 domain-containing protein [Paludibacteraceae bacterium]